MKKMLDISPEVMKNLRYKAADDGVSVTKVINNILEEFSDRYKAEMARRVSGREKDFEKSPFEE